MKKRSIALAVVFALSGALVLAVSNVAGSSPKPAATKSGSATKFSSSSGSHRFSDRQCFSARFRATRQSQPPRDASAVNRRDKACAPRASFASTP